MTLGIRSLIRLSIFLLLPLQVGCSSKQDPSPVSAVDLNYLFEIGQHQEPAGELQFASVVAVTGDGGFLVLDSGNWTINAYGADGGFRRQWGGLGPEPGRFTAPLDLAVAPTGQVYVADIFKPGVYRYSATGVFEATLPVPASSGSYYPRSVTVDADGNAYVLLSVENTSRVLKVSPGNRVLTSWQVESDLGSGGWIRADRQGFLYVLVDNPRRIQVYRTDGHPEASWPLANVGPRDVTPDGRLFGFQPAIVVAGTPPSPSLIVFSRTGQVLEEYPLPDYVRYGSAAVEAGGTVLATWAGLDRVDRTGSIVRVLDNHYEDRGELSYPTAVAFLPGGEVAVGDRRGVRRYSTSGRYLNTLSIPAQEIGSGQLNQSMLVGPGGTLFILNNLGSKIQEFNLAGEPLRVIGSPGSGPGQLASPRSFARDANGALYVADTGNKRIQVFSPTGSLIDSWETRDPVDQTPLNPTAIAVDDEPRVYVACGNYQRLLVYGADHRLRGTVPPAGVGDPQLRLSGVTCLAAIPGGELLATDQFGQRFYRIDPLGGSIRVTEGAGSGPGQFWYPGQIAVAVDGRVAVVERGNQRVQVFQSFLH